MGYAFPCSAGGAKRRPLIPPAPRHSRESGNLLLSALPAKAGTYCVALARESGNLLRRAPPAKAGT